ncbi:hypothetical protein D917_00362 [Trichinella nativa]|uniref:Uncharacterized protein n=1 Tax=Trichinella nativa TaxID=6335 RepID=A0A1Y3E9P6_9BILA|nr:hypothetical protein D917_00362 [Trichinella nativa]
MGLVKQVPSLLEAFSTSPTPPRVENANRLRLSLEAKNIAKQRFGTVAFQLYLKRRPINRHVQIRQLSTAKNQRSSFFHYSSYILRLLPKSDEILSNANH